MYRLYSWEHSYFSGKVRAYLRFKQRMGALGPGFEDILATPELLAGLLARKSGSGAVPQLELPDGRWVQDSSEILDVCERAHPEWPIVPDAKMRPRQHLAAYLIELLADEWLVVPAFWQRWFFSENGREPSHRAFNEQQWGAFLAAGQDGHARRAAGAGFFEAAFGISETRVHPKGVYAGLVHLGCDARTERAWQASQHRVLGLLEAHFAKHDFVLGGRPSLADFGLLGPLYAHLYRDAVAGFALRTHFPLVAEWVERTNGEGALNARAFGQKLYSLDADGRLVGRPASSDGADWLPDDAIAPTLEPVIAVFFEEMWPCLLRARDALRAWLAASASASATMTAGKSTGTMAASAARTPTAIELPGKTFFATPGFEALQTGDGPLTHAFEIGGISARRMVVPYQFWMLDRLERALRPALAEPTARGALTRWLGSFREGGALLELERFLDGCRIRKEGARLYAA